MPDPLIPLIEQVTDEQSFLKFLNALRQQCEANERDCPPYPHDDHWEQGHWESLATKDFLRSMEDWGSRGDFGEGVHHGEPILRRVATMLYVGKYHVRGG
jgi:hypothetical protein